jgi:hypothetical protein
MTLTRMIPAALGTIFFMCLPLSSSEAAPPVLKPPFQVAEGWQDIAPKEINGWKLVDFQLISPDGNSAFLNYHLADGKQIVLTVKKFPSAKEALEYQQTHWREASKPKKELVHYIQKKKGDKLDSSDSKVGTYGVFQSGVKGQWVEFANWTEGKYFFTAEAAGSDIRYQWQTGERPGAISEEKKAEMLGGLAEQFTNNYRR